jgi:redox-sensitive bicupin YhaK (pirin superfamily)
MLTHRRWESLDGADHGWLRAKYHFRIDAEGNPAHQALGPLVVWNDDEIAVGGGFPLHGHRDIEIITFVRQGVLAHRDTLGSEGVLRAGDLQVMSAGTGIRHSEFNQGEVPLKLYQIWLRPRQSGGEPRWETKSFPTSDRSGRFAVLASGFGGDQDTLPIRADARVLGATVKSGDKIRQPLGRSHAAYLAVASGRIDIDGEPMGPFDGVTITDAAAIEIVAHHDSELVLVETA